MNAMVVIIIANFFVKSHDIEANQHTYLLSGVMNLSENDAGIEHLVSYRGEKLPVDDNKKFYARIVANCETVEAVSEHYREYNIRLCEAISISY